MNTARQNHTATLLANGKVLIAGGNYGNSPIYYSAELYDPATGTWTNTGEMNTSRNNSTATLLPNGKVLVAGGGSSGYNSAELYYPATGSWTLTGSMNTARALHKATLLRNGKVLVVGGYGYIGANLTYFSSAELYDPTSGMWTNTGSLKTAREAHAVNLLPNGKLLVAGGDGSGFSYPPNAELYDAGLANSNKWQPQITFFTSPINLGSSVAVTGTQFRGIAEGSSGNSQDSSADYPLLQLRSIESGQTVFLSSTNWGTNSFTSLPVWNFPPGYALATVFVNGIQSTSSIINISVPIPATTTLNNAVTMNNGSFQFAFTNNPGALFGVLSTTNLSLPLTNWTMLSGVTEVAPGQFQFTDPQATNGAQRYYSIFAP
jgi:hypothetical protein